MPVRTAVATGTAGNEALHATMRTAMRQVYDVHLPVLRLKLDLFGHSHQIGHDAAIRAPPLRQMHRYVVLAHVLGRQLIDEQSWNAQCSALTNTGLVRFSSLHILLLLLAVCIPFSYFVSSLFMMWIFFGILVKYVSKTDSSVPVDLFFWGFIFNYFLFGFFL